MTTAARLLRETSLPLSGIARQVGYSSEFALGKAFTRQYALAPGVYRRSESATVSGLIVAASC